MVMIVGAGSNTSTGSTGYTTGDPPQFIGYCDPYRQPYYIPQPYVPPLMVPATPVPETKPETTPEEPEIPARRIRKFDL